MRSEIVSWNPINTECSLLKASIYIKPTLEVLKFFQKSPMYRAVVKIGGTGTCYDNRNIFAIISKSSDVPNCRQNFFNSTGLYVITLETNWYGYPLQNGYVEYMEGIVDDIINYINPCKNVQASPPPPQKIIQESYEMPKKSDTDISNINNDTDISNISNINNDIDIYINNKKDKGMSGQNIMIMGIALAALLCFSFCKM